MDLNMARVNDHDSQDKNLSDDFNFKEKEKAQYTLLQFRGGKKRRTIYFHVQPKNFTKKHFIIKHKL